MDAFLPDSSGTLHITTRTSHREPTWIASLALLACILATTAHLAVVATQQRLLGQFSWNWGEPGEVILTIGGYAIAYLIMLAAVLPLHLLLPGLLTPSRLAGWFAGISVFGTLLLIPRISPWAWMVVAGSIGVRVALHPRARRRPFHLGRAAMAYSAVVGVLVGGQLGVESWRERRQLATLPPAEARAPNVLLLILDTVRARSLGMYTPALATTPLLNGWAADGVVFEAAYATAPWTLPSHASMFTGQYARQNTADWRSPLNARARLLAEWFRDRGYATGGFTANLIATGYRSGLGRGFGRYRGTTRSLQEVALKSTFAQADVVQQVIRSYSRGYGFQHLLRSVRRFDWRPANTYNLHERKSADRVLGEWADWRGSIGDRPWFSFVNLFEAHLPYTSPPEIRAQFQTGHADLDAYHAAIRYLDARVARLLEELRADGTLDNTVVVITSDHGEQFGEHGLKGHGNSLYNPLLQVPLIVIAPGRVPRGVRVATPVSLRDLAVTLQQLTLGRADAHPFPGSSLTTLLTGPGAHPSAIVAEVSRGINDDLRNPTFRGDLIAIVDDSLHVIRHASDSLEAFRYRSDSTELNDLTRNELGKSDARRRLNSAMQRAGFPIPR